jgi:hypothetical protein
VVCVRGCGCEHLVVGVGEPSQVVGTDDVVQGPGDVGLGIVDRWCRLFQGGRADSRDGWPALGLEPPAGFLKADDPDYDCCLHLLTAIGLGISYPERAAEIRLQQTRANGRSIPAGTREAILKLS